MILNDLQIAELCQAPVPLLENAVHGSPEGAISFGFTSFGYDLRAGYKWRLFDPISAGVIDPKNVEAKSFRSFDMSTPEACDMRVGQPIRIPAGGYALTHSIERFNMPDDLVGICVGKSTYARVGVHVNVTPIEPGWCGYLTIEVSNSSPCHVLMYPGEGICQVMFFRGMPPAINYANKNGKYQNQPAEPVLARMK